ncbi:MAG: TraI domain-containing protein [Prevotella sp.]|nr:TraI domain-containing protein [Prevotella sp.]
MKEDIVRLLLEVPQNEKNQEERLGKLKEEFIRLLQETQREGMDKVLVALEKKGFFTAPASAGKHLNHKGGLLEHSMIVCCLALKIRDQLAGLDSELEEKVKTENVVIAALLHDFCKAITYKETEKWRKDANNRWESYMGYVADYSSLPIGHGEKSVVMLLLTGLKLKSSEIMAIRWHMGAWDLNFQSYEMKESIGAANSNFPLVTILQSADSMATHILEKRFETKDTK